MIYVYNDIMDFEEKSFHEWEKNLDRKRVEIFKGEIVCYEHGVRYCSICTFN